MTKIVIENIEYELIENYKEGFNLEETLKKATDYFAPYDYIVGDWSYGKLRLKGFCDKNNKIHSNLNSFSLKDNYIKTTCSYDCRFFVLKKITM